MTRPKEPSPQEVFDAQVKAYLDRLNGGLLAPPEVKKLPPPEYLITDVLTVGTMALLTGKPGGGKTFVGLDFAFSVATGSWWQRRWEVSAGPVLYFYAEGVTGLPARMQAWEQYHRTPLDDFPIWFYPVPVNLLDPAWGDAVSLLAAQYEAILVVIDTTNRNMAGGDENSSRDMGLLIRATDSIRIVAPGATVLLVHHTPKEGESPRGHSSLEGAADSILLTKKEGALVTVECRKQKDAAPFEPIRLHLEPVGDSCILRSQKADGTDDPATASEISLLGTAWESFSETGATTAELREVSGLTKSSYYRARNSLLHKGFLVNEGSEKRPQYWPRRDLRDLTSPIVPPESH
jgi:hypothetical protein